MNLNKMHLGNTVFFVGPRGEIVPAVVTAVFEENRANLALIRDGVNQAHIDPHVYTVSYAPPHPVDGPKPGTWFTRAHL